MIPVENRYSRKSEGNVRMIVDLKVIFANLLYHEENWQAMTSPGVSGGTEFAVDYLAF